MFLRKYRKQNGSFSTRFNFLYWRKWKKSFYEAYLNSGLQHKLCQEPDLFVPHQTFCHVFGSVCINHGNTCRQMILSQERSGVSKLNWCFTKIQCCVFGGSRLVWICERSFLHIFVCITLKGEVKGENIFVIKVRHSLSSSLFIFLFYLFD